MAPSVLLKSYFTIYITLLFLSKSLYSQQYGTCDAPFTIFKHTVASSDSLRDCENYYNIFPQIHDEGATKFHNGECAYQCKLELPYTCFKLHAPQTYLYDEGLLYIDTFEQKVSEKWKYALDTNHPLDYDAFFDYNMAFWVKSLDEYILHWQLQSIANTHLNLEYFGIEWQLYDIYINDINFEDAKFYSILVHSPQSASNFEFISYTKPSIELYNNMKWIEGDVDIPRCTFKTMSNPYPWNRYDGASIVPIRISQATADIDKVYDFYTNVLETQLIYYAHSRHSQTRTLFMHLLGTQIELQFVESSHSETFGDLTVAKFESLLMETHQSIIVSPYCGQNRWMDNHFAYSVWNIDGLMDKIYFNLNHWHKDIKYGVGKNEYEHSSLHTKYELDQYGGGNTVQYTYGLWVIQPTGFTIQIGGILNDAQVTFFASIGDPQWCPHDCPFGLVQGTVDKSHIYRDDLRFTQHDDIDGTNQVVNQVMLNGHVLHIQQQSNNAIYSIVAVLCIALLSVSVCHCVYRKRNQKCNDYIAI